ncbi:MAG: ribose-phosphate diphosphokinase [Bacteroidota bacterium]
MNLDPEFTPFETEKAIRFETFTFSGGEPHIKIISDLSEDDHVVITTRIRSFNDMGLLLISVDALRRMGVKVIDLVLPYMPAARQDRVMVPGEPLTVKVYADLINELNFESVTIFDPHSEVAPALLNHAKVLSNHGFVKQVIEAINSDMVLVSPDGGALKKVYKVSEYLGGIEVIECSKKRNVMDGTLEGFRVYSDDLKGQDCLVIDDICDGGGTFLGLAKALREKNAGDLYLAVSHGIFSRGVDQLKQYYKQIFTTDAFQSIDDDSVEVVEMKALLK